MYDPEHATINCQKGAMVALFAYAGCDIEAEYTSDMPTAQGEST
jgi:hypothetical protein